jgi:hypothetical protein
MRLRTNDGRWYDTESAIHVTDKLRYTRRGNWVHHFTVVAIVIEEYEAIEVMLATHGAFECCPGYRKLPPEVRDRLNSYHDAEHNPADEV